MTLSTRGLCCIFAGVLDRLATHRNDVLTTKRRTQESPDEEAGVLRGKHSANVLLSMVQSSMAPSGFSHSPRPAPVDEHADAKIGRTVVGEGERTDDDARQRKRCLIADPDHPVLHCVDLLIAVMMKM